MPRADFPSTTARAAARSAADHGSSRLRAQWRGRWATAALLLLAPLVHRLALGPTLPDGTFLLLAKLDTSPVADDPSNLVYAFARAPAAAALDGFFELPAAYVVGGLLAHALYLFALFALALAACRAAAPRVARPEWIALTTTLLLPPLAWVARWVHEGAALAPHDTFHTVSFRTLAATAIALGYRDLAGGRRTAAFAWLAASCYLHPTMGLLAFALYGGAAAWEAARVGDRRALVHAAAAGVVAVAPAVWKLARTRWPAELRSSMSFGDWYSQMIKDEADDFSLLFHLVADPAAFVYYGLTVAGVLMLADRLLPGARRTVSFRLAAAVPLLVLAGAGAELLLAVHAPSALLHPLVALTVGYRLWSFAFLPLVWLLAAVVTAAIERLAARQPVARALARRRTFALPVALVWCALLLAGAATGRARATLDFAAWALAAPRVAGIDDYLAAAARAGADEYRDPPLWICDAPPRDYPGERNLLRLRRLDREQPACRPDVAAPGALEAAGFARLAARLRRELPAATGLFVPPYHRYYRDALPDHRVFFQEHHDGNLMMGSPRFAAFWTARMRDLLGFDYEGMPSKASGLAATRLRDAYLAIDPERLLDLRRRYPEYRYFLTEASHALPFAVVLAESGFVVYDLDAPAGPAAEG